MSEPIPLSVNDTARDHTAVHINTDPMIPSNVTNGLQQAGEFVSDVMFPVTMHLVDKVEGMGGFPSMTNEERARYGSLLTSALAADVLMMKVAPVKAIGAAWRLGSKYGIPKNAITHAVDRVMGPGASKTESIVKGGGGSAMDGGVLLPTEEAIANNFNNWMVNDTTRNEVEFSPAGVILGAGLGSFANNNAYKRGLNFREAVPQSAFPKDNLLKPDNDQLYYHGFPEKIWENKVKSSVGNPIEEVLNFPLRYASMTSNRGGKAIMPSVYNWLEPNAEASEGLPKTSSSASPFSSSSEAIVFPGWSKFGGERLSQERQRAIMQGYEGVKHTFKTQADADLYVKRAIKNEMRPSN